MRVLHVIPSLSPTEGGPSFVLPLIVRSLVSRGVTIDVATTVQRPTDINACSPLEGPVDKDGYREFCFPRTSTFYKFSISLNRWLKRHTSDYDLVHVHALFSHAPTSAASYALAHNIPYIIRPLGVLNSWGMRRRRPIIKSLSLRFRELPLLRNAASIHFTSRQEKEEAELLGSPKTGVIIPLGIDMEPFRRPGDPNLFLNQYPALRGRQLLLFLSRLDPKKGFNLLLPAIKLIRHKYPEARLILAGSGTSDFEAYLRNTLAQERLSDWVFWTGFLHDKLKLSAFAAATAFILPSHSENFGIAAVEALASGVPCILTPGVAVADQLDLHGAALVPAADPHAISGAIDSIFGSPELAAALGARGHAHATQEFSMDTMGMRLLSLYTSIANARP